VSTVAETVPNKRARVTGASSGVGSLLTIAVCFGIFAGLIEGTGLLLFQRINWRRWGPMLHVSKEIVWISPVADVLIFALVALLLTLFVRLFRRIPAQRTLVFVLAFLSVYDWLTLTERLLHSACILLALGVAFSTTRWFLRNRARAMNTLSKDLPYLLAAWTLIFAGMKGGEWLRERRQLANLSIARPGAPNVLMVVIDTLRADHLSSYGYSRPTTPNLDRLAAQGVLFENAISACSWTLPSHASLVTGLYPSMHGMGNAQPMPWLGWGQTSLRGYPTLGEQLQRLGYRTGAFSANQSYFTSNVGLGRGFIHFEDYFQSAQDMFFRTLYGRESARVYLHRTEKSLFTRSIRFLHLGALLDVRKHADEVNREALRWIDHGGAPFFAFLNYIDVHDQASPQEFRAPWGWNSPIDRYDSALAYDDAEIGELLKSLGQRGLAQNTMVIITSDHGESLGQHDMQFHGIALYREQVRVPLLIRYMGERYLREVPAGTRVQHPISNVSIAATVMDFASGQNQNVFPGYGLEALWNEARSPAFWPNPTSELAKNDIVIDPDRQARNVEPTAMDGDMRSLITPQWHFIVHEKLGEQLYDWVRDPGETHNLISTPEGKAAAPALRIDLEKQSAP
jgi:arylsulfatase A-like enzyme